MEGINSQSDLSPEEAFASLGLATKLNADLLQQQNPQTEEQIPPEETGSEELSQEESQELNSGEEKPDMNQMMTEMEDRMGKMIKESVKEEMGNLKKELESSLNEEE